MIHVYSMKHPFQMVVSLWLLFFVTTIKAQDSNVDSTRNVNATVGEDTYLEWFTEVAVNVYWYKDGVTVTDQDGRILIIPTHGLLILNSDLTDQGYYTCVIVTRRGEVMERVFEVDVTRSMRMSQRIGRDNSEPIHNVTGISGENLLLEWFNQNPSHVIWIKDNTTIVTSSNAGREGRFVTLPEQGLLILNSQYEDQGYYTCVLITNQNQVKKQLFVVDITTHSINGNTEEELCGYPRVRSKIVGGQTTGHGLSPWMVMLWSKVLERPVCGGALLNRRWIVTAAHCISPPNGLNFSDKDSFEIRLGEHSSDAIDETEIVVDLKTAIIHPNFDRTTYDSDIALLKLTQPITYTDYISPLCLPDEPHAQVLTRDGKHGVVTGWGNTVHRGDYSRELKRARLAILPQQDCTDAHTHTITSNMFCAEAGNRDACNGDSGGPFAIKDGAHWYLIGLVSWGIVCADPLYPGVYTRVYRFKQWIDDIVEDDHLDMSKELRAQQLTRISELEATVFKLNSSVLDLQNQLQGCEQSQVDQPDLQAEQVTDEPTCSLDDCGIKPRRYDIRYLGEDGYFQGWADVQGQGASNDYCRVVNDGGQRYLSCALAGTEGESELNYNSNPSRQARFDQGYKDTWYMKDEDGDGRDDYCRCVGDYPKTFVSCMKAGTMGFIGRYDFTPHNSRGRCYNRKVNSFIGVPMPMQ